MYLEDPQRQLLAQFVEAHQSVPADSRGTFIVTWPHNDDQATFFHSKKQDLRFSGNLADAEALASEGLLKQAPGAGNSILFSVLPAGVAEYQGSLLQVHASGDSASQLADSAVSKEALRNYERYFRDPDVGEGLLRLGHEGIACRNIRLALMNLGFEAGSGSRFDEQLEKCVLRFQKAHKHNVTDGQVGPRTRRRLTTVLLSQAGISPFQRMDDPAPSQSKRVFLSYAWGDGEVVDKLEQWLIRNGITVLRDKWSFPPGNQLPEMIRAKILESDKVIAVYSQRSKGRDWPAFEIRLAEERERGGQTVLIYLVLDETPLPEPDPNRIAVLAKGRTFGEVGEELLHGINEGGKQRPQVEVSDDEIVA